MASVNKVIILGNLGKDPEIRHLENGRMRVQLIIATHDNYKNRNGEKVTHTDWHEVVFWTPHAEVAAQYLCKGNQVYIEGKLTHRSYIHKEGEQRYVTQIVGQQLVLLGNTRKNLEEEPRVVNYNHAEKGMIGNDMGELPL
ncbi:single-stranded DNA-binding protein [Cardinium endosymbiont of Culicoides punctatus]|uniref:single-stranded DNA-binding protein n=1 Tax=Cardinium endosymbiont of Culicoides punctatus TaxID=2304601 RepID=UPI00105884DF|nr:single-stranded DNA-binding protein [Cardinium endosymbiont of Culicoides punctatus]